MKKKVFIVVPIVFLIIFSMTMVNFFKENQLQQVLIGYKDKTDLASIEKYNFENTKNYKHVPVVMAKLKKSEIDLLKKDPMVKYIEPDYKVQALNEVVPWGISRIEATIVHPKTRGAGIKVGVIDTGIDFTHPDLSVIGGTSCVDYTASYADDNGHGTHVAGTIAAVDNEIGVIGAAPQANLYAIKVLDANGSGYISGIVKGIDWAISNKINIINMSLGSPNDSLTLHDACDRAYTGGMLVVAAAGNSGTVNPSENNVGYPAGYASVVAVGATDSSDRRPTFSSTGPKVELAAPGNSIYSTLPSSNYGTLSGTSMASPHVVGTAALVWASSPTMKNIDVRQKLDTTAIDLGVAGRDNEFGYGLVDAKNAVGLVPVKLLKVNVVTNKTWYSPNKTVNITVIVNNSQGQPVEGVFVTMSIKTPNRSVYYKSGKTDTTGKLVRTYITTSIKGIYNVNVTAAKTGYTTISGSTSFTVK